jgi:nucleoside-diphosphate-sugar epimerase
MQFFKTVLNKENIILKTTGNQLRSYSYIFDTVPALLYILLLGEKNEVYNVVSNNSTVSIREFAQSLADITGTALEFENPADKDAFLPPPRGNGIVDIKKLESLGYKSMYNIRDGQINTLEILGNRMSYESRR